MSDEDRKRLDEHFWAIVTEACQRNRCWRGEVLNACRKSHLVPGISAARREIAAEMRRTAFTYYIAGKCMLFLIGGDDPMGISALPPNATPVSFPWLGLMIGVDHSTLVAALQKLKRGTRADDG